MTETKESGFIQLYKEKAVFADYLAQFSIDMAVGWIMSGWKDFDEIHNRWYAMTASEASRTKSRIMSRIGQFIILSQNGFHYLVDTPASISLSDICITDKMLTEYAASIGITLQTDFPEGSVADEGQVPALEERIDEPVETPEKFALRLRDEGVRKEIIAYELKQTFEDNLQWHEIARLADPDKKYTEMQEKSGNPRKTGQRWANTGKMLKEMTSS